LQPNYFVIIFKLGGTPFLLFREDFFNDHFSFIPSCFPTLAEALELFENFREAIARDLPTNAEVLKQTQRLLQMFPLILELNLTAAELGEYVDGELQGFQAEYDLLNAPHTLVKMKPSFEQFVVLDVAMDICNRVAVGEAGQMQIFKTERAISFNLN
jgi:hypothetical protein